MSVYGTNSLRRPSTPKLIDQDSERVRREHEANIIELQDLLRAAIKAIIALGGTV
jgi:uncharacterized membrane protein